MIDVSVISGWKLDFLKNCFRIVILPREASGLPTMSAKDLLLWGLFGGLPSQWKCLLLGHVAALLWTLLTCISGQAVVNLFCWLIDLKGSSISAPESSWCWEGSQGRVRNVLQSRRCKFTSSYALGAVILLKSVKVAYIFTDVSGNRNIYHLTWNTVRQLAVLFSLYILQIPYINLVYIFSKWQLV